MKRVDERMASGEYMSAEIIPFSETERNNPVFHHMLQKIEDHRGPQFWGVRGIKQQENPHTVRPDTLRHRLIDMQYLLRDIHLDAAASANEQRNLKNWAFVPAEDLINTATKVKARRIPKLRTGKLTYHEAHEIPNIRLMALRELIELEDPVIEIVRGLEDWRLTHTQTIHNPSAPYELTPDQQQRGWDAFEVFLFSAGSEQFTRALGHSAIAQCVRQT